MAYASSKNGRGPIGAHMFCYVWKLRVSLRLLLC